VSAEPDYEALAAEAEAKLAKLKALKAKKTPAKKPPEIKKRPKDGETLRAIQRDQTVKTRTTYAHSVPQGKTLINRVEEHMDGRRKKMQDIVLETGQTEENPSWLLNKGRFEGLGLALAVLRSTSLKEEILRSTQRISAEKEEDGTVQD
jgi:hypothetical protein